MRLATIATVLGAAALFGTVAAQAVEFDVGPGGVRVERGHHWDHSYNWGECRTIIDRHIDRRGERVTERRRICD